MKISIGIPAWNEEVSVRTTIHSLFAQSLLNDLDRTGHQVEVLCLPNGCSDATAQSARGALLAAAQKTRQPAGLTWQVHELERAGKTNAWNAFVHELSRPDAEVLFLVDADIQIYMPDTLANMLEELNAHPDAFVATDLPVKHVAFKKRVSLMDRLSLQTSGMTQAAGGQLCGQLYCARASFLRRFRIPDEIIVEDGFIKKMAATNLLTEPDDPGRRIVTAETASHVFEAYTRLPDVFATLRRQTAGYMIHRWIWEFVRAQMQPGEDAGQTMARLKRGQSDWPARVVADRLQAREAGRIYRVILQTRKLRFREAPPAKKPIQFIIMLVHMLLDTLVFNAAVRSLKRKQAGRVWRDTRTTDGEVAR